MVIRCESCQTEFNLDASLLKKEGAKVRCSRCRHVFKAYPPVPELPGDKDERLEISEDAVAIADERTDEVVSEKGSKQKDEDDISVELDSDLDLIYRDVFSEDDRDKVHEEAASEDAFGDPFKEPGDDEEVSDEKPSTVFPGMDPPDPDEDIFDRKEPLSGTTKKKAEGAPAPRKSSSPFLYCDPFYHFGGCGRILRLEGGFDASVHTFTPEPFFRNREIRRFRCPAFAVRICERRFCGYGK